MHSTMKLSLKAFFPIPFFASFLVVFYFSGIVVFGLFRLILLLYTADSSIRFFDGITLKVFVIGFRFDSVILAYVLFLPLLILFIQYLSGFRRKLLKYFVTIYLCVIFPVLIFISIVDIPYFAFFNNRLTEASLQWLSDFGIVFRMVLANTINCLFLVLALILMIGAGILIYKFCSRKLIDRSNDKEYRRYRSVIYVFTFLLLSFMTFVGMRGKITHPIRQGDAFYCNNPLLNQIGLNPAFTLMKSYVTRVRLMDDDNAIRNTQQMLKIDKPIIEISPIARKVVNNDNVRKFNIILVFMESISADYMGIFGNTRNLTPVLDSLTKNSWFFKNAYSAGIHTNNGVFSSLYSLPALRRIRPMSTVPVRTYTGLPYTLKQLGYKNLFFGTHSESFDNLGVFIPANCFDELYTAEDYPGDKVVGPFGVPDDYLYSYTIERLNKIDSTQPFFATLLTCSNHDPYILPAYFKSEIKEKDLMGVNYADWAIGKFLKEAQSTKWFNNTMFIFVSDHGLKVGKPVYDIILSSYSSDLLCAGNY
jgi:phosphoglycerol transferase MdoB-like AlkP superfamily enzyme